MASLFWRLSPDFRSSFYRTAEITSLVLLILAILAGMAIPAVSQQPPQHLTVSASLPVAKVGANYQGTVSASGGVVPYHYSVSRGALPNGLALSSTTGVISGVPTSAGNYSFQISAWDTNGLHGDKSLGIKVQASTITVTLSPTSATVTSSGAQQFTAYVSGTSNTAVTWSASAGSISSSGLFSAPNTSTNLSVSVTATSVAQSNSHGSASVTVTPPSVLGIMTTSIPTGNTGSPYTADLSASGGTQPYAWSIASGTLPSGIQLDSSSGLISGTTSQSGNFSFTAKVTDTTSQTASRSFTLTVSQSTGNFDGPAELPRVYVQSSLADTPAPGATKFVAAGGDFQAALNAAACGDTIQLQAGATFTGNFTLLAKSCDDNHWIIIRSSASDTALPPEGTRITPCYAGVASLPGRPALNCSSTQKVMATLMAAKGGGPVRLAAGANHYRLGPGLEITRPAGIGINYGLVMHAGRTAAVDHIILDRDWVHGTARDDTNRGLHLNGMTYVGIVDSYFNDFHCAAGIGACIDSQAIGGGSGDLPMSAWKVVDNFLEGAAENILFGGATGSTTPTDIEIRRNHMFKPLIWMPGQPGFVGAVNTDPTKCVKFNTPGYCPFIVKNLFEIKNAQRVLVEGNVMEYTWPGFTQHGAAILFTPLSQGGLTGNPNATVADVTFRYNRISHTASGMVIAEVAFQWGPPKLEARLSIHDDIFDDISPAFNNSGAMGVQVAFEILNCPTCNTMQDILIDHITMLLQSPRRFMLLGAPEGRPIRNVTFTNNIVSVPPGVAVIGTGPNAPCGFKGSTTRERIKNCIAPLRFEANALIGAADVWPRGNFFPADAKDVKFANHNEGKNGDYRLSPKSPHKHAGTDGKDLGADVEAVEKAIAGVT